MPRTKIQIPNISFTDGEPILVRVRCGKEGGGKGVLMQENVSAALAATNDQTLFQPIESHDESGDGPQGYIVRRLTPKECERIQGFPDDYTRVPFHGKPPERCPNVYRYKAIGNSMAVPVMRWIGERVAAVDALLSDDDE